MTPELDAPGVDVADVGGVPALGRHGADPVDDVLVPAAEGGGAGRPAAGVGVDADVGRPRPLGHEIVRRQVVRVAVIELGVGRDAEAAAGRRAPAHVRQDPAARGDGRAPRRAELVVVVDADAGLHDQPRADRLAQLRRRRRRARTCARRATVESIASRPAEAPSDSCVAAPRAVRQRPLADTAWVRCRLSESAGRRQS